jgi:hypothetical protein
VGSENQAALTAINIYTTTWYVNIFNMAFRFENINISHKGISPNAFN